MGNIITIILVIIIFFIIFDKKINDNFTNYNITKIGKRENNINIGNDGNDGNIISINTDKHTLQANELCIGDRCLNLQDRKNKTLPRDSGQKGSCSKNQCYDCKCPPGRPVNLENCDKLANLPVEERVKCQACNRGYGLVDGICEPCGDGTYNDQDNNTGPCISCNDCETGKKKLRCTMNNKGLCVDEACTLVSSQGGCLSCDAGHYMNGNYCTECPDNTYNDSTKYSEASCINCDYCNYTNDVTRRCDPICYTAQKLSTFCPDWHAGHLHWHSDCTGCPGNCGEWKRKYRTNCGGTSPGECSQCPPCETGEYRIDCGTQDNPSSSGTCVPCEGCAPGFHRVGCDGIFEGYCIPNICDCEGGDAAEGIYCTSHGANICTTCWDGYRKVGNTCPAHTCSTPMSEWRNYSCAEIVRLVGLVLDEAAKYSIPHNHPHFLTAIKSKTGYEASEIYAIHEHCRDHIC